MTLCLFGSNRERQKGKVERTKKKHENMEKVGI